ncbi:transglutaminase N-terminal domain-containing protein [Aquimarina sp. SS2-1]|uniref:transglutaminase family protein n=1 Tax=Aquimarina besae TaxID=3342247 RepID=UPI00366DA05E
MKFKIIHESNYTFSTEVYLEPHLLRLKPKSTSFCFLDSFNLQIFPKPSGIREQMDAENNTICFTWFDSKTKELTIRASSIITISDYNPFSFIIYPSDYFTIPFQYDKELSLLLHASLQKTTIDQGLKDYTDKILKKSNTTLDFLINLTKEIHSDFDLYYRHEGSPFEPNKTFTLKKGSCRDLAWMQIQILRNINVAARFVSGYYYIEVENPSYELHAWTEVFIPGAGWIGLDPSYGIVTGNTHIPLASSAHYKNTMTVTGTVRGDAVSELNTNLHIEVL